MADYNAKVYHKQGGAEEVVASGGLITVESGGAINIATGGALKFNGTDVAAKLAASVLTPVAGVAAGYKVARGEATLDGSNPTAVATGLATVVAAVVCLKAAATPGDDPTSFSVDYGGGVTAGSINIYAYKSDGTDPTLIPSTNAAAVVAWIAVGT